MKLLALLFGGFLVAVGVGFLPAQQKKEPATLVFPSKMFGDVPFDHAKHTAREKNDCKICHDALWPQDAKAPLNYKANMHKTAEAKKTSCAFCHVAGGKAFASANNCNKCHVKKT
jgi:c(7)-type cytochrome triheme protein